MEPALWARIEELLQAALDREPAERAAFLDEAVGGEPDLRREVEALLAQEHRAGALSVSPAAGFFSPTPSPPPTLTGQTLGRYRVGARIGAGGMGEVYEAHDDRLQRTVAIKALPEELAGDPERARRFEQEALAVSKLNHPNIITIFEVVHFGQAQYLVAEHVEGCTLRDLLTDPQTGMPRALAFDQALDIAAQVTAALQAAHTAWIIHRDIKPENIMVRPDGLVKVLDFGIAKHSGPTSPAAVADPPPEPDGRGGHAYLTAAGAVLGTRGYMSPEQARGEALDGRTDLFSLGLVLYEMVSGERPTPAAEQAAAAGRQGRLPGELRDIVRKLLQSNREQRYASASELAGDLQRVSARVSGRKARRMVAAGAIAILVAAAATTLAALLSVSERWEERVLRDGHVAAARQAVFSPDGRLLVSAGEDGRVIVWDFARRQRLATLDSRAHQIAFSPDGRSFATGAVDGTVVVWDTQRFRESTTLRGHRGEIGALGFSPDGTMLVSSARNPSTGETILWRTSDWTKARVWPTGVTWSAVLFSPHSPQVALSRPWAVYDLENGSTSLDPHRSDNWASLSPDATRLATVDPRGEVAFYRFPARGDLRRSELLARHRGHQDHGRAIAFSPDGRLVASGAEGILLWDATSYQKVARLEHSAIVWSLAFHPTGRWLASSHADGAVLVWDVAERELVANSSEHSGAVRSVAFSPDGARVASGGEDRTVVIWDARTGRKQAVLAGHQTRVAAVAFLPAGGGLASADQDGVTILWDLGGGRPRWVLRPPVFSPAYSVAASADGRHLATSNGLYTTATGHRVVELSDGPGWAFGRVYGVAFSPDGRRLALVTDRGWVLLYETASGRLLDQQQVTVGGKIAVAFSGDGEWLVTGEDEGAVRLWNVSPLRQIAVLGRHAARVKSVAFSPEGDTVASAGDDKTIALWDVARRRRRATIGTHGSPIYSIAFSPDGRRLVSGEHDRSVRVYTRERSLWGIRLD